MNSGCFPFFLALQVAIFLNLCQALNESVGGRLTIPELTVQPCLDEGGEDSAECQQALQDLSYDPFYLQLFSGGSESSGNLRLPHFPIWMIGLSKEVGVRFYCPVVIDSYLGYSIHTASLRSGECLEGSP